MSRCGFLIVIGMVVCAGAAAQEELGSLTNMSFDTSWAWGETPPGWAKAFTGTTGPSYWETGFGAPNTELDAGAPTTTRCKFELYTSGAAEGVLYKEVNWGTQGEITQLSAYFAGRNWVGGKVGVMGIGVDLDGGGSSWADVGTNKATIIGAESYDQQWRQVTVPGPLLRPEGATTFTIMLYASHDASNWEWNCQVDEVSIATLTVPTPTPGAGVAREQYELYR